MSAQIIQIRDYQTLDERLQRWCRMSDRLLAETIAEAPCEMIPYHGVGLDGMTFNMDGSDWVSVNRYSAPDTDSA